MHLLRPLKAGADVLLCPSNPAADITAILNAVKSGQISPAVIEERNACCVTNIYSRPVSKTPGSTDSICKAINSPEAEALIKRLAAASITVLKNQSSILPLSTTKVSVVNIGAKAVNDFAETVAHYADIKATNPDVVIAAVYNDNATSRETFARLVSSSKDVVAVFFVNPVK